MKQKKRKKRRSPAKRQWNLWGIILAILAILAGFFTAYKDKLPWIPPISGDNFAVYFVDVGQGDSAVVVCDGKTLVIDAGTSEGGDTLCNYLSNTLGITQIDHVIATHPHADHIGGLPAVLKQYTVKKLYSPVDDFDSKTFSNIKKYASSQNLHITVPQAGQSFSLGSAMVEFLAPLGIYDDINDISLVAKITYGKTTFLFTGDAERASEKDMVDSDENLSATVLKVGHHGSSTSSSYVFLREVMPQYAVISCGAGNSYGHPHEEVVSRLKDVGATIYRTDLNGTITCHSDGNTVSFTVEKGKNAATSSPSQNKQNVGYVGNIKSKKFHSPNCSAVLDMDEKNRIVFASRAEAIRQGYQPCGTCKP